MTVTRVVALSLHSVDCYACVALSTTIAVGVWEQRWRGERRGWVGGRGSGGEQEVGGGRHGVGVIVRLSDI